MAEEQPGEATTAATGSKKKFLWLGIGLVVLLALLGIGGWLLLGSGEAAPAEDAENVADLPQPALYLQLEPAFLANYSVGGRQRYLQVSMAVMTRQQAALDALQNHMPMVRNRIIMLLGARDFAGLLEAAGREQLQADVLAALQEILVKETGPEGPTVEQVFFTNLVMQ